MYSRNVNVESVFKFFYDYTNKKVHVVQEHANSLIVVAFLGRAVAISVWPHQGLNAFKIVIMNAKNRPKILFSTKKDDTHIKIVVICDCNPKELLPCESKR